MQDKQEQFIELYEKFNHELSCYCRALMADEQDARDLASETILLAYEKFASIREPEKFKYYLFGIASRLFRKKLRRQRILQFTGLGHAEEQEASDRTDSAVALKMLQRCIRKLPANQAEVLVFHEISGYTLAEISEILQMNLNTVKTNLSRARQKLEKMLATDRTVLQNQPVTGTVKINTANR